MRQRVSPLGEEGTHDRHRCGGCTWSSATWVRRSPPFAGSNSMFIQASSWISESFETWNHWCHPKLQPISCLNLWSDLFTTADARGLGNKLWYNQQTHHPNLLRIPKIFYPTTPIRRPYCNGPPLHSIPFLWLLSCTANLNILRMIGIIFFHIIPSPNNLKTLRDKFSQWTWHSWNFLSIPCLF